MYYARLSWIITYLNQTHISKSTLDIYFNVENLLAHLLLQKVIRHFITPYYILGLFGHCILLRSSNVKNDQPNKTHKMEKHVLFYASNYIY